MDILTKRSNYYGAHLTEEGERMIGFFGSVMLTYNREAMDFIAFVTSSEGQKIIASYTKHGINLFYPDAIPISEGKKKGK